MHLLIDGYNLMHARGLLGRRFGPDGFRKVRHRFLNELAAALGPIAAHQTTIVFDASQPPEHRPGQASHKGLTVVYAVGDESADDRIERLIAAHSAPKTLTVVSSDHRIRQAAARRHAITLTADAFLDLLESRQRRKRSERTGGAKEQSRRESPSPQEAEEWLEVFGHLEDDPETRAAFQRDPFLPTDEEIARIEREVAEEP
ncbi:MAG: NYN domain-containing protein [Isosphaeraceae bacterium]|nr:NYN domain-containing protein [Isosphaeraceae bacterium]